MHGFNIAQIARGVLVKDAQQLSFMILNLSPTQHFVVLKYPFSYCPQCYRKANSVCQTNTIQYGGDSEHTWRIARFSLFFSISGYKKMAMVKIFSNDKNALCIARARTPAFALFLLNFLM